MNLFCNCCLVSHFLITILIDRGKYLILVPFFMSFMKQNVRYENMKIFSILLLSLWGISLKRHDSPRSHNRVQNSVKIEIVFL